MEMNLTNHPNRSADRIAMAFAVALAMLIFVACSDESAPPPSAPHVCVPVADFKLTPAPPVETPLERWKRTKSDWDRASKLQDQLERQIESQTTMAAIGPYMAAEQALKDAHCDKLCIAEKSR